MKNNILVRILFGKKIKSTLIYFTYNRRCEGNIGDINDDNEKIVRRKFRYQDETDENSKAFLTKKNYHEQNNKTTSISNFNLKNLPGAETTKQKPQL